MTSERTLARIAGSLYLVVAVGGGFAELVVRSSVVEPGNAAATADNIRASATLFRASFVADLVQATFFLFTAMALYLLLRHVDELVARAMVVLVAVSVAIICLNLLNQWVALQVATGQELAGAVGNAEWTGVPLAEVLELVNLAAATPTFPRRNGTREAFIAAIPAATSRNIRSAFPTVS